MKSRLLFILVPSILVFLAIVCLLAFRGVPAGAGALSAHAVPSGESFDDNPLKGFMPYSYASVDFPHSLEWFYLPMSALYPDQASTPDTEPDWTAMEKELNTIAGRGCQAAFRIVLDFPSNNKEAHPFGIPQFLLKDPYNLKTYSYDDYSNIFSKIPDYTNPSLGKTIVNCIAALGKKYDGDKRIGFITAGFLGFWGEWHCYPYNGVASSKNYEPKNEVFDEVSNAYANAFKKTPILFRYPKGTTAETAKFGFHDDSYCFETVPVTQAGGNAWNFGELLKEAKPGCADRWMTAPIGGELRPEIQAAIFKSTPWAAGSLAPLENWENDLKIIHPSWLLNQAIADYEGAERDSAVTAGKQMGYDFRVRTAYFADHLARGDQFRLSIDLENIGVAPFYFDHTTWPVKITVEQKGKEAASWLTSWDLNGVATDGKPVRLDFATKDKLDLAGGYYDIFISVQNPLENGKKLGFANEYQYPDGRLFLGTFGVGNTGALATPQQPAKPEKTARPQSGGPAYLKPQGTAYEAEDHANLNGFIQLEQNANYSGGEKVKYIGREGGWLLFPDIKADKAGKYTLTIYYLTAPDRQATISVNGGPGILLDFKGTGSWTKVVCKQISVDLAQGTNTIKFYNDAGWAPDVDMITVE